MTDDNSPVEAYLDELLLELRGTPRELRRALREVEEHLRDAVAEDVAAGEAPDEAARRAVERFGPAAAVAAGLRPDGVVVTLRALAWEAAWLLAPVAAAFLIGIGVSGAVAAGMGAAFGKAFVAGDVSGVTYTPDRCAEYREYEPHARSCTEAAVAHHFGEIVDYRLGAGMLGLLLLAAWWLWRRRRGGRVLRQRALPDVLPALVGGSLATAAAGLLIVSGAGRAAGGAAHGAGGDLSGGVVAAALAACFAVAVYRDVRGRRFPSGT